MAYPTANNAGFPANGRREASPNFELIRARIGSVLETAGAPCVAPNLEALRAHLGELKEALMNMATNAVLRECHHDQTPVIEVQERVELAGIRRMLEAEMKAIEVTWENNGHPQPHDAELMERKTLVEEALGQLKIVLEAGDLKGVAQLLAGRIGEELPPIVEVLREAEAVLQTP